MKKIYIFDMDGTLTPSRREMTPDFEKFFSKWANEHTFFLVSGSNLEKIQEQVPQYILDLSEGVFTCGGNQLWLNNQLSYNHEFKPSEDLTDYLNDWGIMSYRLVDGSYILAEEIDCDEQTNAFFSLLRTKMIPGWYVFGALTDSTFTYWEAHAWGYILLPMDDEWCEARNIVIDDCYVEGSVDVVNNKWLLHTPTAYIDWIEIADASGNLINSYFENPPKIQYENVPFPNLPKDKVIGLVTIKPKKKSSFFKKGIHTIPINSVFIRRGSNTIPIEGEVEKNYQNSGTVHGIENNSRNSM